MRPGLAVVVALGMLVAGCARAAPVAGVSHPGQAAGGGCARSASDTGLTQTMDGRISGCLRIEPLAAGIHTVVLDQLLDFRAAFPIFKLPPRARRLIFPREPNVALTVSPGTAAPGTTVTITGRLARAWPGAGSTVDFCWDGCRFGLRYEGVTIRWVSHTKFRATLVLPAAPWIEGDPVRVAPLASGVYPIAVQCLVAGKGCSAETREGVAAVRLLVRSTPGWCPSPAACAQLAAAPRAAAPGALVSVTGFAPLVSIIGSDQPFAFQFEVLNAAPRGPEVRLGNFHGGLQALLGEAPLDVLAPPVFASLGRSKVLAEAAAGLSPISAEPRAPSTVAWCARDAVEISKGAAVTAVPTIRARSTISRLGLLTVVGAPLRCDAVALAGPADAPASVIAAAFAAEQPPYGGPPFYEVALTTRDRGRTWTPLPVPRGATPLSFGGFRYTAGGVEAVFASVLRNPTAPSYPTPDPAHPRAEISSADGKRWRSAPMGCPSAGPCVTLGPYVRGACAMAANPMQPLLRSADGGVSWLQPVLPDQVDACGEVALVATGRDSALLVNSLSPFPLLETTDGGLTWEDVALPALPGAPGGPLLPGGITMLPNGSLLLTGGTRRWQLLEPGARKWCRMWTPVARLPQISALTVIGEDVWWLAGNFDAPNAEVIPVSAFGC